MCGYFPCTSHFLGLKINVCSQFNWIVKHRQFRMIHSEIYLQSFIHSEWYAREMCDKKIMCDHMQNEEWEWKKQCDNLTMFIDSIKNCKVNMSEIFWTFDDVEFHQFTHREWETENEPQHVELALYTFCVWGRGIPKFLFLLHIECGVFFFVASALRFLRVIYSFRNDTYK